MRSAVSPEPDLSLHKGNLWSMGSTNSLCSTIIVFMFEQWLEESLGDPGELLSLAADNHGQERRAGCRKLVLAAAWADCHGETTDPEVAGRDSSVLVDRFVRMGPLGTPLVAETCPSSLALAQQSSMVAARLLIGDALAIRHRLPQLWERVKAGEVMVWKARDVARRTCELTVLSARVVDRIVTGQVELLAWGRFEKLLDATAFLALVNRVAECLAGDGDEDPVAVRRSKASGSSR